MLSYDLCQLLSTPCRTCAVSKKIDMERYLKSSDAVGLWYIILICGIRFVRLSVLGDCLISESSGSVGRCGSIHDTGLDASAHGRDSMRQFWPSEGPTPSDPYQQQVTLRPHARNWAERACREHLGYAVCGIHDGIGSHVPVPYPIGH